MASDQDVVRLQIQDRHTKVMELLQPLGDVFGKVNGLVKGQFVAWAWSSGESKWYLPCL
jgi:hypothetical protein